MSPTAIKGTALVTGASGGIGRAIALALGGAGYRTALHYNTREAPAAEAASLIKERGGTAEIFPADLTAEPQVERLFAECEKSLGPVSLLVNNAGVSWQGLFTDMTLSDWQRVMDVNLTSMFLCCRRALPAMIRAKSGCIINISSIWGQQGAACEAAYSASKAAVIGLTQALAREEGPSGIRVNCIAPGVIDTPMNARLTPEDMDALREEAPLMRIGSPEDVAEAVLYLASADFVTGQVLGVNGGFIM